MSVRRGLDSIRVANPYARIELSSFALERHGEGGITPWCRSETKGRNILVYRGENALLADVADNISNVYTTRVIRV